MHIELIGIYIITETPDAHLVELIFDCPPDKVEIEQITQEIEGEPKDNWQSPWNGKYLDDKGERIIGDGFSIPERETKTRLIFFFHYLDISRPLLTQEGELKLISPNPLPDRLKGKLVYELPD